MSWRRMALLNSLRSKAHLIRQFSPSDWPILAEAWWMLFLYSLALLWMSYERIMISEIVVSKESQYRARDISFSRRLHRLVGLASRLHFPRSTCLVRSLALQRMLLRRNVSAQVCIGMNRTLAEIHAHAWIEVFGETVGEAEDVGKKFRVLESVNRFSS